MTYTQAQRDALIATVALADDLAELPEDLAMAMPAFVSVVSQRAARLWPIVERISPNKPIERLSFADRMLAALNAFRLATDEDSRLCFWANAIGYAIACKDSGMAEGWRAESAPTPPAATEPAPAATEPATYTECFTCGAPMGAHLQGCPESATEPADDDETEEERATAAAQLAAANRVIDSVKEIRAARARIGNTPAPLACVACGTGSDMTQPGGGLIAVDAPDGRLIALCFDCQRAAYAAVAPLSDAVTIEEAAARVTEPAHIAALLRRFWLRPATIPTCRACSACGAFLPVFDTSPCPYCDPKPSPINYFGAVSQDAKMIADAPIRAEYQRRAAVALDIPAYEVNDAVTVIASGVPGIVRFTPADTGNTADPRYCIAYQGMPGDAWHTAAELTTRDASKDAYKVAALALADFIAARNCPAYIPAGTWDELCKLNTTAEYTYPPKQSAAHDLIEQVNIITARAGNRDNITGHRSIPAGTWQAARHHADRVIRNYPAPV